MRNRILEIVVFLLDFMRENEGQISTAEEISLTLSDMGYTEYEIDTAYDWFVEQFSPNLEPQYSNFPDNNKSVRILSDVERTLITPDAFGFLSKLLNSRIVNKEQFEKILERATMLSYERINLDQIKALASAVIFNDYDTPTNQSLFDNQADKSNNLN